MENYKYTASGFAEDFVNGSGSKDVVISLVESGFISDKAIRNYYIKGEYVKRLREGQGINSTLQDLSIEFDLDESWIRKIVNK